MEYEDYNDGFPFLAWEREGDDAETVWGVFGYVEPEPEPEVEVEVEKENNSRGRSGSRISFSNTSTGTQQSNQSNTKEDRISSLKKILIALNIPITPEIENILKSISDSSTNTESLNNNSKSTQSVRDLEMGMTGDDVKSLQTLLIAQGYSIPAGATGFFATQTKDALSKYQFEHGISPAVGYFGSVTRSDMKRRGLSGLWW